MCLRGSVCAFGVGSRKAGQGIFGGLQSVRGYLGLALVFAWDSALRGAFGCTGVSFYGVVYTLS